MTTAIAPDVTTTMRGLLAWALATCDGQGVVPYNVEAHAGGRGLRIYLDAADARGIEEGRRLFAALGGNRHKESRHGRTWSICSSEWNEYAQKEFGCAYNVPFGGDFIDVQVVCSMTEDVGEG